MRFSSIPLATTLASAQFQPTLTKYNGMEHRVRKWSRVFLTCSMPANNCQRARQLFLDAKRYQYLWRQQLCANNDHLPFRFFKFYYFLVSISQHDCHFGRFWGSELWCVPPPPADQVACNSQPASSDNQEPNIRCHRPRSGRYLTPFFYFIYFQYRCGPKLRNDHAST